MRATTIFGVTLLCAVCGLALRAGGLGATPSGGSAATPARSAAQPRTAAGAAPAATPVSPPAPHDLQDGGASVASDAAATPGSPTACTTDADCRAPGRRGRCFTLELAAQYTQSFRDCADAQAWRAAHNPGTCVFDECRPEDGRNPDSCGADQRCGTLDMVPFPQRVCVPAACANDWSCRRQVGGRCASYLAAGRCQRGGWACSYPSDVCAPRDPHRMCPVQRGAVPFCAPRAGRFTCVQDAVAASSGGT